MIEWGDERLQADQASYARDLQTVDARGNAYLQQPGLRITGSQLHYNLETRQGNAQQAEFRLTDSIARGSAGTAELLNPDQSRYTDITYTTCPPGNSDWLIRAEQLEIDQETGVGVARHAKLSFKGVPFLYSPYVSFRSMTGGNRAFCRRRSVPRGPPGRISRSPTISISPPTWMPPLCRGSWASGAYCWAGSSAT